MINYYKKNERYTMKRKNWDGIKSSNRNIHDFMNVFRYWVLSSIRYVPQPHVKFG